MTYKLKEHYFLLERYHPKIDFDGSMRVCACPNRSFLFFSEKPKIANNKVSKERLKFLSMKDTHKANPVIEVYKHFMFYR